jgi:hypothetical protein
MDPVILTETQGRVALSLTCVVLGRDLSVTLSGGEGHIGAVALAQPRPAHRPDRSPGATTSVLALLGHREDDLARELAANLARRLGAVVCLACGIHLDAITPGELDAVGTLARSLADRLVATLEGAGWTTAAQ